MRCQAGTFVTKRIFLDLDQDLLVILQRDRPVLARLRTPAAPAAAAALALLVRLRGFGAFNSRRAFRGRHRTFNRRRCLGLAIEQFIKEPLHPGAGAVEVIKILDIRMIRVSQVKESVLLLADIDERAIDRRKDGLNLAFVNVAQAGTVAVKLDVKIVEALVIDDRDAAFAVAHVNEDLSGHTNSLN